MTSKVIMSLDEYNKLKDTIYTLNSEIDQMVRDREAEMKEIFKLENSYAGVDVFVDATGIIKEIYGEEISFKGSKHKLNEDGLTKTMYGVYRATEVEEHESTRQS